MNIFRDNSENPLEHDRSMEDRRRHRQLVERSIKDNISDILSEESIIGESGNKRFKIPIRGLKEYQFIYGKNSKGVGSGTGDEERGEKLGSAEEQKVKGKGTKAGNEEGEEIYETEITLEELLDYIIEDLELPYIDKKKYSEIVINHSNKRRGYQRYGINPRLAKKRTVMAKIARKQNMKKVLRQLNKKVVLDRFPFKEDDLKYYKVRPKIKKESNAAIIFIMDVSASMDNSKKYLARSFFFILSKFIRKKYNNVQITFISHTTVASVVNEYEFFHRTESGGTYISSGLKKAIEIIKNKFPKEIWNVYAFYASDGDNWSEDNDRTIEAAGQLCSICNMLGYTELLPSSYGGSIYNRIVKEVVNNNFTPTVLKVKSDLWSALKLFLGKELRGY